MVGDNRRPTERGTYAGESNEVRQMENMTTFQDKELKMQMEHDQQMEKAKLNQESRLSREIEIVSNRIVELEKQYREYQSLEKRTLDQINSAMQELQALKMRVKQEGRKMEKIERAQAMAKEKLDEMLKRQSEQDMEARAILNKAQHAITEGQIATAGVNATAGANAVEATQMDPDGDLPYVGSGMGMGVRKGAKRGMKKRATKSPRSVAAEKEVFDTGLKQMQYLRSLKQGL